MVKEKVSRSQRSSRSSADSAWLNSVAKSIKKDLEEVQERQFSCLASSLEQLLNYQRKQDERLHDIENSCAPELSESVPEQSSDNGQVSCKAANLHDSHVPMA